MLENILIKYFDLPEYWNEDYDYENTIWNESYGKLIDLLCDLDELGVLNVNKIVDKLDKIYNMEE